MTWFKKISLAVVALALIAGLYSYIQLSRYGLIPRQDLDTIAPDIPSLKRPAILVFNKTNVFIHKEAIPAADAMLTRIAKEHGWGIYISDNGATHTAESLKKFDLVIWNNVTGTVLTHDQQLAFKQWLENGGGWLGLHAAGDSSHSWKWYLDNLIGTHFIGHTLQPQFQDADLYPTDEGKELTQHLPSPWHIQQEEWYAFAYSPREKGHEIVLTIDEASYNVAGENWMGYNDHMQGEHPMAWRQRIKNGRAFYSAIGHQAATYNLKNYEKFIAKAMDWALNSQSAKDRYQSK